MRVRKQDERIGGIVDGLEALFLSYLKLIPIKFTQNPK